MEKWSQDFENQQCKTEEGRYWRRKYGQIIQRHDSVIATKQKTLDANKKLKRENAILKTKIAKLEKDL